ncbi:hypothetical protein HanRHA438_Chr03g0128881 [Helianthus annuus]|nr:hypothetical protein HanRHA438_Chr03g0128881 [Helianthus annuus]
MTFPNLFWYYILKLLLSFPMSMRPRYNKCCKGGKIEMQYPTDPPDLLKSLFSEPQFMVNIHAYNAMFSMTSFGATVDDAINDGSGPYVFKVVGQVSHWLGSLCPDPGDKPRFLQMYIFDSQNEVENRLSFFPNNDSQSLSSEIVTALSHMLDQVNGYVRLFRSARELCLQPTIPNFGIKLYSHVKETPL